MKRLFMLLAAIVVVVTISSCNKAAKNEVIVEVPKPGKLGSQLNEHVKATCDPEQKPESGEKVFVLTYVTAEGKKSGEIIYPGTKYPQLDTSWYEGSTFFHIQSGIVL